MGGTLTLSSEQLLLFRSLQTLGAQMYFTCPRGGGGGSCYREYGGYLVVERKSKGEVTLKDVVVATKTSSTPTSTFPGQPRYPIVGLEAPTPDQDHHAFSFHTHPGRRLDVVAAEPAHI